jgi:gliding motility-associated-like protein
MTIYSWTGPNGFTSLLQNPSVSANSTLGMAGVYTLTVTNTSGCSGTASTTVTVNALPLATASNNGPICIGNALIFTGGPAAMATYAWTGPNGFSSSLQNPSVSDNATFDMAGVYTLTATSAGGCIGIANTTIIVNVNPIATAGPGQELTFVFETRMEAELSSPETGEWSLISGSGQINDIHSPTTLITHLQIGVNKFLWKVKIGDCVTSAEVNITIFDLFVPSVITPDGDGKNDYFKISETTGNMELIVFNRWGIAEYTNRNYKNEWDGRNNRGAELPNDTYFYVVRSKNGEIKKGSVLIIR